MDHREALAYLDERAALGIRPGLDRIGALLSAMGDPQESYPVIHIAGTNGKTTTTRLAAAILDAHGLGTGTFTSPPLAEVEEHFTSGGVQMSGDELGPALGDVAPFVDLVEGDGPAQLTSFEILTAVAFAWFLERSVEVAVVEAGLGGGDDATNVATGRVAVITGIGTDHADLLGPGMAGVAAAKVGILDPGAVLVSGPVPPEAAVVLEERVAVQGASHRRYGADFRVDAARAVGGWLCDVDGIYERYEDVFLPLHGRHQTVNLALAIAACEELVGRPLAEDGVRQGVAAVRVPGRVEVVGANPAVVLDVAHNPEGAAALAAALTEEFLPTRWVVVFGARGARDPAALLEPLQGKIERLFATAAAGDGAAIAPDAIATAAGGLGVPVEVAGSVAEGLARALAAAGPAGGVVVTGSHRVVGEARAAFPAAD